MNACVITYVSIKTLDTITTDSMFFDANGQCLSDFFDNPNFEPAFSKSFHSDKVDKINIMFIDEKDNVLCGWYRDATLYLQAQYHMPTQREFHAITNTHAVFLLPKENRLKLPVILPSFQGFLITDKSIATKLVAFLDTVQGHSQFTHLSLDPSEHAYRPDLEKNDVEQIFQKYQDTADVFLLPTLYWSAQKWSLIDPNCASPCDYMGFSLLELARPQDALPHFERALQINPLHKSASCDKGECLLRLDRVEDAVRWFNEVIERIPEDDIRMQLSDAYLFAGFPGISYRLLKEIQSEECREAVAPIIKEREVAMPYLLNKNPAHSVLDAYPLLINFMDEHLQEVYEDTYGIKRYVDPIRQKGVPITPEETIRQKVVSYLQNQIGIPKEAIFLEESLAHIDRELRDRVDILVRPPQSGQRKYVLLIECKAPGIALEGDPTAQLLRYNAVLQAPFIMLTNGDISHLYHFDAHTGEFKALREMPLYKEMCELANIKYAQLKPVQWVRPEHNALSQPDVVRKYALEGILGEDSPHELAPFLLNLAFCLLDENYKIECPLSVPGCTIIKDYGVIPMTTGNAGGGHFFGNYRWFGVLDRHGHRQNVYVTVCGVGKSLNHFHWKTRAGITTLYFAIEEKGVATSRLQIRLDSCLISDGDGYRLTHTGVRSRGKIQPLIAFIAESVPELLGKEERILCGRLDKTQNLYLSNLNVAQTIGNAISYLLLRSEYRMIEQRKREKQ